MTYQQYLYALLKVCGSQATFCDQLELLLAHLQNAKNIAKQVQTHIQ